MRLPCDAALIVMSVQEAIDDAGWGSRNNDGAEAVVAALLGAWRGETLPIVHIRHDSRDARSPYRPGAPGHRFKIEAQPLAGEPVVAKSASGAFAGTRLEETLDAIGATTLVVCGALTDDWIETSAREAGDLGYRVFVVADACWAVERSGPAGELRPAAEVHARALAFIQGRYARVVDSQITLQAAALANARRKSKRS